MVKVKLACNCVDTTHVSVQVPATRRAGTHAGVQVPTTFYRSSV